MMFTFYLELSKSTYLASFPSQVSEVIPIPELHTMMGCANSGFNKLKLFMKEAGTMEQYLEWCKSSSITLHGRLYN